MSASNVLSPDELAAIDASYTAIPAFGGWPQEPPRPELWDRYREELEVLKQQISSPQILTDALQTAMRAAAFDTGAIEGLYTTDRGLTITVATQAAAWEREVDERGPDTRTFFDAQLEAYELVMDVATESRPVTEVWIRHLHEVLTKPQETYTVHTPVGVQDRALPRGKYKDNPNHVRLADGGTHAYAPVDITVPEMGRLVTELSSDLFLRAHPLIQASYSHYCLAAIHPFADGNGRVARAVASTYLYRAASIPLLVLADQRTQYLEALELADQANYEQFIRFIGEVGRAALGMVIETLRTALAPGPSDAVNTLHSLLKAQGGLTHAELDAIGMRLFAEIGNFFREAMDALTLPPGAQATSVQWGGVQSPAPAGFRQLGTNGGAVGLSIEISEPARARSQTGIRVFLSKSLDDAETFLLIEHEPVEEPERLVLGLGDVHPVLTASAQYRIRTFIDRLIGATLQHLLTEVRTNLAASGYHIDQPQDESLS
jgi:Fic family protein